MPYSIVRIILLIVKKLIEVIGLIEVENVTKRYAQNVALNSVSFTVNDGEILGFLGPNGAGKSTAMNIITGYISATDGTVKLDGIDILESPEEAKKKIGYLPELPPLYMDMTVLEYLHFVSRIKKVPLKEEKENTERIMDVVKITDMSNRLIKNLSKGYKQRVGLAQAIMGDPEVLILDEPTVGLDPKQIIEIRTLIKDLGKKHTIILSSHILPEVSAVCDRVIIIDKGRIVASGTPEELSKELSFSNKLSLRIKGNREDVLKAVTGVKDVEHVDEMAISETDSVDIVIQAKKGADIREDLFNALNSAKLPILMMKSVDLTLEEVFLQVTTKEEEGSVDAGDI